MIEGRNFFDQPIKTDLKTYGKIRRINVKVMIMQLDFYQIIPISKNIMN